MRFERARILPAIALVAVISGCTAAPRATSIHTTMRASMRDGPAFWATLAEQPIATNDDALHAILLFLDDADDSADYTARIESLRSRGVLPKSFNAPADEAINRGTVAVAVANMLGIRGGVTMSLLGTNARYAIRELEFCELFPSSTPNQIFSGGEFVALIDRTYSYIAGDPADYAAAATRADMKGKGRIAVPHRADVIVSTLETLDISDRSIEPAYLSIASGLTLAQPVAGSQPSTEPSTSPIAGTFRVVQVVARRAQVKLHPGDKEFVACVAGMELSRDSTICTDPKGMVWIETEGKLLRAGGTTVMRVGTLKQDDGSVSTTIDIERGTGNLDFERGGPTGNAAMRSPNSTLAVRGTKVSLYDQPGFEPRATSLTGTAEFENFRRQHIFFGKLAAPAGSGKFVVTAANPDPAAVAYQETVVDPTLRGARTDSEQQLVAQLLSRGAVVSFDRSSGLLIVRGGSVPTNFSPLLQGSFNVVLTWRTDVNLNLGVASPGTDAVTPPRKAEFVYPSAGLARTASGGATRFDHRGGNKGGYEVVSFNGFDNGTYAVVVENVKPKTPRPVNASFRVFLDGEPVTFTASNTVVQAGDAFRITVSPQSPDITFVDVGELFPFPFSVSRTPAKKPAPIAGPVRPPVVGPVRKSAKR